MADSISSAIMDLRHFKLEKSKPYDVIICDYDMPI
jgi:hypothetical protein